MNIETVSTMDTVYSADCIDFCPIETFEHLFVVGTYELQQKEEKNIRIGRLYLLSVEDDNLTSLQQIDTVGILDVRWCTHAVHDKIIVGLVNSEGMFITYSLEDRNHLNEIRRVDVCVDLALYMDWSTRLTANSVPSLTISDSEGFIRLYSFNDTDVSLIQKIKAHRYEAWVTSFNYWNPSIIYSGGDDCELKGFDIRSNASLIFSSKAHTAGVTAIQPSLWKEELLFSGCYDGELNAWDTRNMKCAHSKNLGGGVWRLRCEPKHEPLILASTMHNGFQLLEVNATDQSEVIGTYSKHESLAYGADWSWLRRKGKYMVGSVSFYDHLLSLWEFDW